MRCFCYPTVIGLTLAALWNGMGSSPVSCVAAWVTQTKVTNKVGRSGSAVIPIKHPAKIPARYSDVPCRMAHKSDVVPEEADVIVIGSGLAGLSCAALLAHCGKQVAVLESHDAPGGCAHTWERRGFHFESGPSLYSGFSTDRSPNPLKNIFQIVAEDCDWITYDRWGTVLPNGKRFAAKIGPEEFGDVLREHGGPNAEQEFATLMERMKPLSDAAQSLTSMALREDLGVALTLLRYPKEILMTLSQGSQLTNPFANIMEELNIQDPFVKNWLDMLLPYPTRMRVE